MVNSNGGTGVEWFSMSPEIICGKNVIMRVRNEGMVRAISVRLPHSQGNLDLDPVHISLMGKQFVTAIKCFPCSIWTVADCAMEYSALWVVDFNMTVEVSLPGKGFCTFSTWEGTRSNWPEMPMVVFLKVLEGSKHGIRTSGTDTAKDKGEMPTVLVMKV